MEKVYVVDPDHTEEKRFDRIFLEILNDVLNQVFGDTVSKFVLHYMKLHYGIEWERIPENLEIFIKALKEILGLSASLIEGLILHRLCSALNLEEPIQGLLDIEKIRKTSIESKV